MRPIPPKLRDQLAQDPYMKVCARRSGDCMGRITWEHAILESGRQLNERWSIIPLCERHHLGDLFKKDLNRHIAYQRATDEDLEKYPKSSEAWKQEKKYLESVYVKN